MVFVHRYGFVTFQNEDDAVKVLQNVSNCEFLGFIGLELIVLPPEANVYFFVLFSESVFIYTVFFCYNLCPLQSLKE